ncbi:hypothetical protein [Sphingomonas sp. VNH70]|uniref:hypothetical protein n=1 Tax=Sphingomonas silueang TaxID=3156617 RepID=UPI0032B61F57
MLSVEHSVTHVRRDREAVDVDPGSVQDGGCDGAIVKVRTERLQIFGDERVFCEALLLGQQAGPDIRVNYDLRCRLSR